MKYKVILNCFLFLLFPFLTQAQSVEEIWEKHMKNARDWYEIDEFQNALQDFIKAKETLPTDSVAYLEGALSAAYANNNDSFEQLKEEFTSVFKYTSPAFNEYSEIMFMSAVTNAEGEELVKLLKIGVNQYPNNSDAYAGPLLATYFENNQIEEAQKLLERIVPTSENPEFAYTLGVIYQNTGAIEKAIDNYEIATTLDINHLDANYNLGTVFYNQAVAEINKINELSLEDFEKSSLAYNMKATELLKMAKPYIDKAASGDKNATDAFEFLQTTLVLIDHMDNVRETLAITSTERLIPPTTGFAQESITISESTPASTQPIPTPTVAPSAPSTPVAVVPKPANVPSAPAELMMSDLAFEYEGGVTTLSKGGSGKIKLRVDNWGKGAAVKPIVKLLPTMSVPGLSFDRAVEIKDLGPGEGVQVEISVHYEKPNAVSRGFKTIKAPQNKFRVMIQDSLNNRSDMQEFVLNLDQSESTASTPAVAVKTVQQGKNYLLLIACNDYQQWTPLVNAVNDAKKIKDVLTTYYHYDKENVFEIYNGDVTKSNISKMVREINTKIGEEDKLLIYYSGHGYYDDFTQEGYWVPASAAMSQDDMSSYLSNTTILNYIKGLNTKHTLLIADACFSGSLFATKSRGMMYAERVENFKSRWGLSSGGLTEVSDGNAGEHSPFNHYLTKYLVNNTIEKLTISSIALYVRQTVMSNTMQEPQGKPLRNVGHEGGEYIFHLKASPTIEEGK
ncbi:caspase family protein [Flammeovirga kamogawensis]|uniref:Caspase family protein n=1 Tax=Flammeovirga kamogawensis TaxID=373891 RepID=A0ABX8H1M2_9BACT|nr:caspase family protein [Flammeovirga kamogawensis]MBB6462369.1 tetratricopeptide (TPR) repeat protein [Flammeovirga kamogawensis]QWG09482.1 caspase family protein [Flammeovirga kamogawensis]TRX64998.1 hypothetical protein EO216_20925 [Flammeovirga kamogawensis]